MRLGFIGTGKIASSVITGICTSKISFQKILVSPRNRNMAQKLKKRFRKVNIAKNDQEIVDKCDWIFLAVTPQVGKKILSKLNFRSNQKIISFISTINSAQLKKIVKNMTEKSKISVRNIRREANDELKKLLKTKDLSEDEEKKFEKL